MTASNDTSVVLVDGYVPLINLGLDGPPDPARRGAVAQAVGNACETSGFFVVTGHGVPAGLAEDLHRVARTFFLLPSERKAGAACDPADPMQRGYGFNGDNEVFSVSRLGEPGAEVNDDLAFPNRWPEDPAFRTTCLAYYEAVGRLAGELMGLMATALHLPQDWFDDKFGRHMTPMSINYYPPRSEPAPPGALRHGAHTDFGTVTLLHQDDAPGGLQVLDRDRQWVDVPPIPGTFVVNLGRLMTMWTNDRYPSTVHRVVCPPEHQAGTDRVSIAYFSQPDADALISCIPTCMSEQTPAKHRDITSAGFLLSRTRRVFLENRLRQRAEQNKGR